MLYNENCLNIIDDIIKSNSNVIIVSDPPFNIKYHYNSYKDNMNNDEYIKMLVKIFKNNKSVIIHYPEQLYELSIAINKVPNKVVSWVYNSNLSKQHRDIVFYDIKPNFNQVKQPYKEDSEKTRRLIEKGSKGARIYDWWNINQVKNTSKEKTKHPCQMPLEVMKNIIGILPYECTIIDPFMGSGTTGVAVNIMNKEQNVNRKFIGIELDKEYFDIAYNRIKGSE